MMPETQTLHRFASDGIDLLGAIHASGLAEGTAFLIYGSRFGGFAKWHGSGFKLPEVAPAVDEIYEARSVGEGGELRWWLRRGLGQAVWVSETDSGPEGWEPIPVQYDSTHDHDYLVWGVSDGAANGWSTMRSPTTAAVLVPVEIPAGHLARIRAREFHGLGAEEPARSSGNAVVLEERLLKVEDAGAEPVEGQDA